ncbi:hypothetical protein NKG94_16810 [Micromonospora sp. M12]
MTGLSKYLQTTQYSRYGEPLRHTLGHPARRSTSATPTRKAPGVSPRPSPIAPSRRLAWTTSSTSTTQSAT